MVVNGNTELVSLLTASPTTKVGDDGKTSVIGGVGGLIVSVSASNTASTTAVGGFPSQPGEKVSKHSGAQRTMRSPEIWVLGLGFTWSLGAVVLGGCLIKWR